MSWDKMRERGHKGGERVKKLAEKLMDTAEKLCEEIEEMDEEFGERDDYDRDGGYDEMRERRGRSGRYRR